MADRFGSAGKVELKSWDYAKKESVSEGEVDLWMLSKALKPEDLAYILDNWVNSSVGNPFNNGVKMGRLFQGTHRTLQGCLVNLCLGILSGLGETDIRWTDPRNEKAIQLAQMVKKLVDDNGTQMLI